MPTDHMLTVDEFETNLNALRGERFPVLSAGGITLIDAMGSDYRIAEAARTTSDAQGKGATDDRNLIRYLMRHRHCYDSQTEVLTDRGFLPWPEAVQIDPKNICLGIWDPQAGSLYYENPEYFTVDDYRGPMYRIDHGGVDLLVTPEHSLYVKYGQGQAAMENYQLVPASEVGNRSMVRYTKLAPYRVHDSFNPESTFGLSCNDVLAFLRFTGFFIGDGSISKTSANCVEFRLKRQRKRDFLREVCLELGWECRELSYPAMSVHTPRLGHTFREQFYDADGNKQVPHALTFLNQEESAAVLAGMRASDGTGKRSTWAYATSVRRVAEAVQLIALHAGEAAHINERCSGMFGVMMLARMREPVVNQGRQNTSTMLYSGQVFCAKTRTGVLVVRRNGKIVLSGNSTPVEFPVVCFLIEMPMDSHRQQIRHRTASVNEFSSRYSEVPDVNDVTAPDKWRKQSQSNRQGSSGDFVTEWPTKHIPARASGNDMQDWSDKSPGEYLSAREQELHELQREVYQERLAFGVAKEQARKDLCLSTYTRYYWQNDLHNTLHYLGLRMDSHAQWEIRQYANAMFDILKQLYPVTCQAFLDYRLNALTLTDLDKSVVRTLATFRQDGGGSPWTVEDFMAAQHPDWVDLKKCRERDECLVKLQALGLVETEE